MKLLEQQTCFGGMETIAQSVHINYFCCFILNKLLTLYFIHIQLNVGGIGLATVCTFLHSLQANSEAKSWKSLSSL